MSVVAVLRLNAKPGKGANVMALLVEKPVRTYCAPLDA